MNERLTGGRELRLSENEIILAIQINGPNCLTDMPYDGIDSGVQLTLRREPADDTPADEGSADLILDLVKPGVTRIEGVEGEPPTKFFEGRILRSDFEEAEAGKETFGLATPDGFVTFFPDSPDSDFAARAIFAGYDIQGLDSAEH